MGWIGRGVGLGWDKMGWGKVKMVKRRRGKNTRQKRRKLNKKEDLLEGVGGIPRVLGTTSWDKKGWGKDVLNEIKHKQKRKTLRTESREKKVVEQTEIKIRSFPDVAALLTRCWGAASSLEAT